MASREPDGVALLAGVNNSASSSYFPSLRYPESDVRNLAKALQQPTSNIKLTRPPLLGRSANAKQLKDNLTRFANNRTSKDFLLTYFTGHAIAIEVEGLRDIYLVTSDFDQDQVVLDPFKHLSMKWLQRSFMDATKAGGVLLILDCVYAGQVLSYSIPDEQIISTKEAIAPLPEKSIKVTSVDLTESLHDIFSNTTSETTEFLRVVLTTTSFQPPSVAEGYSPLTDLLLRALNGEVLEILDGSGQLYTSSLIDYLGQQDIDLFGWTSSYSSPSYLLASFPPAVSSDSQSAVGEAQPAVVPEAQTVAQEKLLLNEAPPSTIEAPSTLTGDPEELLGSREQIDIAIRALADTPSDIDLLQFADYADALVDFIKSDETQKPLTIAIDAAWGMGKTTLMKMIQRRLDGTVDGSPQQSTQVGATNDQNEHNGSTKPAFPNIWFNAWQYDQEDSLWAALVLEILDQLGKQFTPIQKAGFWWSRTQKRLGKRNMFLQIAFRLLPFLLGIFVLLAILLSVAWLWQGNAFIETIKRIFLPITGALAGLSLIYASVKDIYARFVKPLDQRIAQYVREPNYKDRIGFLAQFKDDFTAIVEAATSDGKWPLIIFIDDLDRCAPPKPVEIIEAINLLLDSHYCVFVMGMDTTTVAGSIEAKYKDLLTYLVADAAPGELTLGQRFLEKIIQITFHLPRADAAVVQTFIDTILVASKKGEQQPPPKEQVMEVAQLIEAEQRAGKSLDAAADAVRQIRTDISDSTLIEAKEDVRAKSFDDSQVVQDVIRQVAPFLELNPRKIKRFINLFRLQALIANRRGLLETEVIKLDTLARWIVISTRWPGMVDALLDKEDFINRLKEARVMRETIRRERLKDLGHGENINTQLRLLEGYESQFDTYKADPHIKLLVDADDLANLLNQLTAEDIQALPIYLHLTQITSQTGG